MGGRLTSHEKRMSRWGHRDILFSYGIPEAATWQWLMVAVRCWPERIEVQCLSSAFFSAHFRHWSDPCYGNVTAPPIMLQ